MIVFIFLDDQILVYYLLTHYDLVKGLLILNDFFNIFSDHHLAARIILFPLHLIDYFLLLLLLFTVIFLIVVRILFVLVRAL